MHRTKITFFKAKGSLLLTGEGLNELGLTMSTFENLWQSDEIVRLRRLTEVAY